LNDGGVCWLQRVSGEEVWLELLALRALKTRSRDEFVVVSDGDGDEERTSKEWCLRGGLAPSDDDDEYMARDGPWTNDVGSHRQTRNSAVAQRLDEQHRRTPNTKGAGRSDGGGGDEGVTERVRRRHGCGAQCGCFAVLECSSKF
jgi:hypothetical protein